MVGEADIGEEDFQEQYPCRVESSIGTVSKLLRWDSRDGRALHTGMRER